ncbi:MAG: DUF2551 domain-containing protein [Methanogenium sp.]|nr:DUF2551 domain-containing protein [Methanogenium sp.]
MRSPGDLKKEIKKRLQSYLSRDKNGIRHDLLRIFIKTKSVTIAQTFEILRKKFTITYQSVASMVGTIASRMGILHVRKNTDNSISTYELKSQYADLVISLVGST